MVTIKNIFIGGYRNIKEVSIDLQPITSLLAPNNYGKSNVLDAISFGERFIYALPDVKQRMMGDERCIPINKHNDNSNFTYLVEGSLNDDRDFQYGFSFEWDKYNKVEDVKYKGKIVGEYLKIRDNSGDKPKYSVFINRNTPEEAKYVPSRTGRCDKSLSVAPNELALNKLSNFDELFFVDEIDSVLKISINAIDTLKNPRQFFSPWMQRRGINNDNWLPQYLYDLKKNSPNDYEYLISAVTNLIPGVEMIEPVRISYDDDTNDVTIPFDLPYKYDIRVKEACNNQITSFQYMSTGSMKILVFLSSVFKCSKLGIQLLLVEELENSIHPRLLQSLLNTIKNLLGDTKLLITSHSPNLAQYLTAQQIYVGLPSEMGLVDFRTIRPTKVKSVLQLANEYGVKLGEYLFELMLDTESDSRLIDAYFTLKKGIKNE